MNCDAQDADSTLNFKRLNIQDGLISSIINDLVEDHDGFLWISTYSGLSQFDGTEFTNYYATSAACGLANDHISNLRVGPEGNIYMVTKIGWSIFNVKTQCFENFQPDNSFDVFTGQPIVAICPGAEGIVWLGTRHGLVKYDLESGKYTHFATPASAKMQITEGKAITEIEPDPLNSNQLVCAFSGGICHFDIEDESFLFDIPPPALLWPSAFARSLHIFDDSVYWYGSWGNGLGQYNVHSQEWSFYLTEQGKHHVDPVRGRVPYDVANGILPYDGKHVWIGFQRGLGVLSLDTKTIEIFTHDPIDPTSISSNIVESIVRARSGVIYVGTDNGLNIYDVDQKNVIRYDPKAHMSKISDPMYESSATTDLMLYCARMPLDETKLMYSDAILGGITILDLTTNQFEHLSAGVENGRPRVFYDYTRLENGRILLGSDRNLFLYDPDLNEVLELPSRLMEALNELHLNRPRPVLDMKGELFIWDTRHIVRVDGDDHIIQVKSKYIDEGQYINEVGPGPDGSLIIWLGKQAYRLQQDSLVLLDMSFVPNSNTGSSITIVDTLWIATMSSGIFKYQQKEDSLLLLDHYTAEDGLPSNNVTRLSADFKGNIWGTSLAGIFCLNLRTDHIRLYNLHDGIELAFIDEPVVFFPDGSVVFDDRRYIYRLTPVDTHEFDGAAYISSFEFADSTYYDLGEVINLAPFDNTVTIRMGIIDHIYGPRDELYYKLDGFDDTWQKCGKDRATRYTNLAPGDYIFSVRARNPNGIYSKTVRAAFNIKPAFYQLAWFAPALILLLLGGMYILFKLRIRNLKQVEIVRTLHNKKIAELELKALRSQMNPHFMFNSLNSIKNYIQKAEPQKASEYLSNFAHLIRLTLQHSREQNVSLQDELEALLLYIDLEKLRFREGFAFNCTIDETIDLSSVSIPPMILQPYVENAIWHGLLHKEGERQLSLYFGRSNGMLECSIEDNGIGREKAQGIKSKSATRYKSMGMGITSDRIDIMNQMNQLGIELEIIDKVNAHDQPTGTRVNIKIPYESNSH